MPGGGGTEGVFFGACSGGEAGVLRMVVYGVVFFLITERHQIEKERSDVLQRSLFLPRVDSKLKATVSVVPQRICTVPREVPVLSFFS